MLETLEEKAMLQYFNKFTDSPFQVKYKGRVHPIGEGSPTFTVDFRENIPVSKLAASTSLALGEAYMDGIIDIEGDLYDALDHFLGQMGKFTANEHTLRRLFRSSLSKRQQKEDVSSHYDLGNDFYRLWLDETLSYSCAYFRSEEDSLLQAQINKVDYILEKLYLKENMTLLDIGCGWGFLLLRAAKKYHIRGTGITLSEEQYREFEKRIEEEGLSEYLTVKLMDYRDLPASGLTFDRVVSVGMVEHVGRDHYQLFVNCVEQVLKDGGLFLLHFISGLKEHPGDPWMKKYIFPGGMVPSLRELISCLAEENFHTLDVENLRLHYHKTLLCWEKNFREHKEEIRAMFDDRFVRMWELYLSSCAATFHNGIIDLHQIIATKGVNNQLPMVRWY